VLEGWTVLTAVAARTTRVRLGTLVLGASYRHPAVVAKMAATLDHVSGGRLTLGLGAGWQPNEHTAYGIELSPAPARLARFAEYVAAIRSLLREPSTSLDGEWFRLTDATCDPPPVQRPLSLLVGGGGEQRTMRVAALHADAWHTWASPAELARKNAVLDQRCAETGRDPSAITRVTGDVLEPDELAGALQARLTGYAAAGADEFVLRDHSAQALPDALKAVDRLVSAGQAAAG
jgi:alkanesulfonate monooxygenase SsuD/methylene tetrahydromethanopterin reductase-like flavin-dependent oxidoreductase (luciferase family)